MQTPAYQALTLLATLLPAAQAYCDDLQTGLDEGLYDEGADSLKTYQAALADAEKLIVAATMEITVKAGSTLFDTKYSVDTPLRVAKEIGRQTVEQGIATSVNDPWEAAARAAGWEKGGDDDLWFDRSYWTTWKACSSAMTSDHPCLADTTAASAELAVKMLGQAGRHVIAGDDAEELHAAGWYICEPRLIEEGFWALQNKETGEQRETIEQVRAEIG